MKLGSKSGPCPAEALLGGPGPELLALSARGNEGMLAQFPLDSEGPRVGVSCLLTGVDG